jgi:ATP-dependent helicase/nuclease subunit B
MSRSFLTIPPTADFWPGVARALLHGEWRRAGDRDCVNLRDYSAMRVLVPARAHVPLLQAALAREADGACIPPRIATLHDWLEEAQPVSASSRDESGRLMALYAALRQEAWLKKLFAARRNIDLLPLAQTLLTLFDELTRTLLPVLRAAPDANEGYWQAALQSLPAPARTMLSDEAQLVWSLWKGQLDADDPAAREFAQMMRLAQGEDAGGEDAALAWVGLDAPDAMEAAWLAACAERMDVLQIQPDWRVEAVGALHAAAWPEMLERDHDPAGRPERSGHATERPTDIAAPASLSLSPAQGLEQEAVYGAQTVIDWLRADCRRIAIVAQDRAVARRIRALLERAGIRVADEAGWPLSTTRSAAAIDALFDAASPQADCKAVLDLLKSPLVFAGMPEKDGVVMRIERLLWRHGVTGGWNIMLQALREDPAAHALLQQVADHARRFSGRNTLAEWLTVCDDALTALGMREALAADDAGMQIVALLDALRAEADIDHVYGFAEWRALIGLRFEALSVRPGSADRRVVMLQLPGASLRTFDAVLVAGADALHLPSRTDDALFFSDGVRRELGLTTRDARLCRQLRAFAGLLLASPRVVLSWQAFRDGEPNPVSPWIARLQLALAHAGAAMPERLPAIAQRTLRPLPASPPAPSAPRLLPQALTASGCRSLLACPYQFFATRMLGLDAVDAPSDLPQKRDYSNWLHRILRAYHDTVREQGIPHEERAALLYRISEEIFGAALDRSPAALAYYARWQKAMPAYLAWAGEREREGWQFVMGAQAFERMLQWEEGVIALQGHIDRIDANAQGQHALLDYKTRKLADLRGMLKEDDAGQLAFQGLVAGMPVAHAHLVALEPVNDRTGAAEADDFDADVEALERRLRDALCAISRGAPLPASGAEQACRHCHVRGLCRKGGWW